LRPNSGDVNEEPSASVKIEGSKTAALFRAFGRNLSAGVSAGVKNMADAAKFKKAAV
jgi:hypothetical protein